MWDGLAKRGAFFATDQNELRRHYAVELGVYSCARRRAPVRALTYHWQVQIVADCRGNGGVGAIALTAKTQERAALRREEPGLGGSHGTH